MLGRGARPRSCAVVAVAAVISLIAAGSAGAATPSSATLAPNAAGQGKVSWTGTLVPGTAAGGVAEDCFGADDKPDTTSGCDFFTLNVSVPPRFYEGFLGGVEITLDGFAPFDVDLGIFRRHADGTRGAAVGGSGNFPGEPERSLVSAAQGSYYIVAVPYAVPPGQSYQGAAQFKLKRPLLSLPALNDRGPRGAPNYRASHDRYISHSEPTIAMDPLNHDHLIAGSKMYENLEKYFFKIGTYESFDGGRHWRDYGFLPGYCQSAGQCDPNDDERYRVTSDVSTAFDDEGNAYANVLDAPGGATSTGWNMTVHVKRPGRPWSAPIVAHDNRNNDLSANFLLDDKNWIAVDNHTDTGGGPNRPRDGKIGTIYVCWSFDGPSPVSQQIVVVRSVDGGNHWGGFAPDDNTPYPLSQKSIVSGIGCHIAIGPRGEVYATWYDNQLDALMQAKSTNRGQSWTPARPIAQISGVNEPFPGQSFRNLSIPTTGVDSRGNVYVAVDSCRGEGEPVSEAAGEIERLLKERREEEQEGRTPYVCESVDEVSGEPTGDRGTGADIIVFKSTDGGSSYSKPVLVNRDRKKDTDQFQPWLAITDRDQVDVSYFDRRRDPSNFFIDTYLSRSNDGGRTFRDTRASRMTWDPRINPPISPSGEFIGDYQGLVADDEVAIPFWNDTQFANLKSSDRRYSPWQEAVAARVPNTPGRGGPRRRCVARRARVRKRSIGRIKLGFRTSTVASRLGLPGRRRHGVWRYCVRGGGKFIVVFSKRKRALFIASTARRHRRGRAHPGITLRRLRRIYRHRGLRRVRSDVRRVGPIVFGIRRKRVRYIGVVARPLRRSRRLLIRYHKRAGFATTHKRRR